MAGHDLSTPAVRVPGRRAARPRHLRVGHRGARRAGGRQLVADRDRLADRREPARPRADADQGRLAVGAGARLRRAGARRLGASRCPRGRRVPSRSGCRCPRARCRRCGRTTSATSSGYLSVYDGYYLTGDGGLIDEDGYVYVMGRTDDVLNVAGHRLSTGSIEAALAGHPDVAECAVIGVADDFKGQVPRGLVVLKGGVDGTGDDGERICAELVQRVRDEVGAVASLRQVDIVSGAAQDPLGQDPAQDDARDGRRQDPDGARHHRGRVGARRPRVGAAARRLTRLRRHAADPVQGRALRGWSRAARSLPRR